MQDLLNKTGREFVEALARLPDLLSWHILLTVIALSAGLAISLPLSIAAARRNWLRGPLLTAAGVVQTIPSIAMLVLIYAALIFADQVIKQSGGDGLAGLSLWSAVIALTLYSMLPVMRNTVTGILGVDATLTEAARGMGMTPRQSLFRVELPLAMPVIIAGIRTSTVWIVGIATLAQPVGQKSLGDYIFTGLQLTRWGEVLLGCLAAAVLAIVLDLLIALLQSGVERGRRAATLAATVLLLGVAAYGVVGVTTAPKQTVSIGAKTFDEQFILASLLRDRLADHGFNAAVKKGLGSTVAFTALANDQIDAYVDYSGTIWAVQMKRTDVADADTVLGQVTDWLKREHGIVCLGRLGFANAYALAMRRDRAEQLGVKTIDDLKRYDGLLKIGGDYEFFGRPEWKNIVDTYGLRFGQDRLKKYQSTLMYQAVRSGEVDVIGAFSSDGRIAAYDLVVLEDPRNAIPPYDAILLVSQRAARTPGFVEAIRPIVGRIPDDLMRRANYMVDREQDKRTVGEAARWLAEQME